MNTINFDLKQIDDFDTLEKSKQILILQTFNLNKYRFILNEMKYVYDMVNDKKLLEDKMTKLFKEGCLNFHIINSSYTCNIYIGNIYYLYFNNEEKKYYLYVLKKPQCKGEEYKGKFKLTEELIWKKID